MKKEKKQGEIKYIHELQELTRKQTAIDPTQCDAMGRPDTITDPSTQHNAMFQDDFLDWVSASAKLTITVLTAHYMHRRRLVAGPPDRCDQANSE